MMGSGGPNGEVLLLFHHVGYQDPWQPHIPVQLNASTFQALDVSVHLTLYEHGG